MYRLWILFFGLTIVTLSATSIDIVEHAERRYQNRTLIFASLGTLIDVLQHPRYIPAKDRSYIHIQENDKYIYLIFSPVVITSHKEYSRGTYIIRRTKKGGAFSQIKILLTADGKMAIRIFPYQSGVRIQGSKLFERKSVYLPIRFESILLMSFKQFRDQTAYLIDWNLLFPDYSDPQYEIMGKMVASLRAHIANLPDRNDGAMDEQGNFVYINTLLSQDRDYGFNCSGFAKWVIDGVYLSKYGKMLSIDDLKTKYPTERGTRLGLLFDDSRDPYFGLDWSRNLASQIRGIQYRNNSGIDVNDIPLIHYYEDIGYEVKKLGSVLYWLAVKEPGNMYVGSVNKEFGKDPVLRQHVHVVVLLPYFDRQGKFHPVVLERNRESSVGSLISRYNGDFIHLVRVPISNGFSPPSVPSKQ